VIEMSAALPVVLFPKGGSCLGPKQSLGREESSSSAVDDFFGAADNPRTCSFAKSYRLRVRRRSRQVRVVMQRRLWLGLLLV
jgi:hypothetical protein